MNAQEVEKKRQAKIKLLKNIKVNPIQEDNLLKDLEKLRNTPVKEYDIDYSKPERPLIERIVEKFPARVRGDFAEGNYRKDHVWTECLEWAKSDTRILLLLGKSSIGKTWNACNIFYVLRCIDFAIYTPDEMYEVYKDNNNFSNKSRRSKVLEMFHQRYLLVDDMYDFGNDYINKLMFEVFNNKDKVIVTSNYNSVEEMEENIPTVLFKRMIDEDIDGNPRAKVIIK